MPSKRFPIRGGFYALADRHWSQQDLLNLIPVPAETAGTKTEFKLDHYGVRPFVEIGTGAIRGAHNVEGKYFCVSGTQLYQIVNEVAIPRGTIPGVGRVSMAHNQFGNAHQVVIDNGSARYVYNDVTFVLEKVTDASFPGSFCAFYVDQYLGFVEPQGRYWGHSDLADATDYNSLDTYEAEADPDRILWAHVSHREVLIFGQDTIEPYVNAPVGDGTAPFQRAANTVIECGLGAKFSVQSMDSATFFLDDKRQVRELRGYQAQRISNAGVEEALAECSPEAIARAYAFTWQHGPHKVYYLTVPGHVTFGFDLLTREWHRRSSPGRDTWRLSTLTFWNGQWVGGDAYTGRLYTIDADYCFDGTEELEREYRPGVLFADQRGIEVNEIEVLVTPGAPTDTVGTFPAQPEGPTITGDAPEGYIGEEYSFAYTLADGTPPYVVTLRSGTLPAGLSLSSAGVITGSPTTADDDPPTFVVRVTDANGLWDELTDEIPVALSPVTMVTNEMYYTGPVEALVLGETMGWLPGSAVGVSVAPGGQYAVAYNPSSTAPGRFQIRKFNSATLDFDAVADPAVMPTDGPQQCAWHPSGDYLLITDYISGSENWLIYARSGDTFTKIDDPAEWPSNVARYCAWSFDGTKFAVNNQTTANQLAVYTFADGVIGALNDGLNIVNGQNIRALGWQPIAGSELLWTITTSSDDLCVIDTSTSPPTELAQVTVANIITAFWTADGDYIIAICGATDYIRVYEFTGSALTLVAATIDQPAWLPQGVGFTRDRTRMVLVRNIGGGTVYPPYPYSISAAQPPVIAALTPPVDMGAALTTLSVTPEVL